MDTQSEQKQSTTFGPTSDYLSMPDDNDFVFSAGDFTLHEGMFDSIITKEVYDCPGCFKQHTDMAYRYVDVYSGSDVVARLALGILGEKCLLHGVAEKWSRESLKAFKTGYFSVVVPGLKGLGVTEIVAVHLVSNRWRKFIKMLHFSEPETFLLAKMEI